MTAVINVLHLPLLKWLVTCLV